MTKQSFVDQVNIQRIIAKYRKTGHLDHIARHPPTYGSFDGAQDYVTAAEKVLVAQEEFDALPADIRQRFSNNPAELLAFLDDESNQDEAMDIGLIPDDRKREEKAETQSQHGPVAPNQEIAPEGSQSPEGASAPSEGGNPPPTASNPS